MKKEGQQAFSFEVQPIEIVIEPPAVVKEAPKTQLDTQGHRWWASLARGAQEHCIGQLAKSKTEPEMGEWASIAKTWKSFAAKHEKEGLREGQ